MLATRAADNIIIVAFNNLVGGQDELISDGGSMILDQKGDLLCQGKQFEEDFIVTDLNLDAVFLQRIHDPRRRKEKFVPSDHQHNLKKLDLKMAKTQKKPALPKRVIEEDVSRLEEIYRALVLGVSDYVKKNGFKKVVLGLSGGIDSSLVAAIAADALGRENVIGVAMPSPYTSSESQEDAESLASNFKIKFKSIPHRRCY